MGLVSSASFQHKTFSYLKHNQLTNFQYPAIFVSQSISLLLKLSTHTWWHHKLVIHLWSSSQVTETEEKEWKWNYKYLDISKKKSIVDKIKKIFITCEISFLVKYKTNIRQNFEILSHLEKNNRGRGRKSPQNLWEKKQSLLHLLWHKRCTW